jgi:hypothetical protein
MPPQSSRLVCITNRPLSRLRILLRKTSLKAGAVVLAAGAATTFLAAPASAASAICGGTYNFDYVQAQVDNCPGNGAAGWAWLWAPEAGGPITGWLLEADLYVTFANGDTATLPVGAGSSGSESWWPQGYSITQIQVCEYLVTFNGLPVFRCSAETGI